MGVYRFCCILASRWSRIGFGCLFVCWDRSMISWILRCLSRSCCSVRSRIPLSTPSKNIETIIISRTLNWLFMATYLDLYELLIEQIFVSKNKIILMIGMCYWIGVLGCQAILITNSPLSMQVFWKLLSESDWIPRYLVVSWCLSIMQVINGVFLRIQLKIEGCDVRLEGCLKNYRRSWKIFCQPL